MRKGPFQPATHLSSLVQAGSACLLALVWLTGASLAGDDDPLSEKGPIQEISQPLKELIDFRWRDRRLDARFLQTYDEVSELVEAMYETVGYGGGSTYDDDDSWSFDLQSEKISGCIKRGGNNRRGYQNSLYVRETRRPYRTVSLVSGSDGSVEMTINAPSAAYLLRFRQAPDGQLLVQEVRGTEVYSRELFNFDALLRDEPQFSRQRLIPALEQFGFGTLLSPYNETVQQQVIRDLSPLDADQLQQAQQLTEPLNASSYADRQDATEIIRKQYEGQFELFQRIACDPQFSPEARMRVRAILYEKAPRETLEMIGFVSETRLADDPDYLVWLLQSRSDQQEQQCVANRFREISHQDVGPDRPNWAAWLAANQLHQVAALQITAPATSNQADPLAESGPLQQSAEHIAGLLRIVWRNQHNLGLDRAQWSRPFGDKQIKQLAEEIEEELAKRNLPSDWFNPGGEYPLSSTGHPQVLFAKFKEAMGGSENDYYYYNDRGDSLDRSFETSSLQVQMTMAKARITRRQRNPRLAPFHLVVEERKGARQGLSVQQEADGKMQLRMTSEKSNLIVQLIEVADDRVVIQDLRGSQIFAAEAASLRQLIERNRQYFQTSFFPLLQHYGVAVDQQVLDLVQPESASASTPPAAGTSGN